MSKRITPLTIMLILILVMSLFLIGCSSSVNRPIPLEEGELNVSGTYYGYETYTTPNSNTSKVPDTVTFPWKWELTRTSPYMYTVHCSHPAVEGNGSIKASPKYEVGINNVRLVDNSYLGIVNYIQVYFEENDGVMIAHGYYNMVKSTGETDVRVINLTRTSK